MSYRNIEQHKSEFNDCDYVYSSEEVRRVSDVIHHIEGGHFLAIKRDPKYKGIIDFALYQFNHSDGDGENEMWTRIFEGTGPSDGLREMRHIYWGEKDENGYIYYLDMKAVTSAFKILGEYFD